MKSLYLVKWRDARGGSNIGWRSVSECIQAETATVLSCGFILHEDDQRLVICPHVVLDSDNNVTDGDAEISIPRDWVVSKLELFAHD